jgi:hypothetical protein
MLVRKLVIRGLAQQHYLSRNHHQLCRSLAAIIHLVLLALLTLQRLPPLLLLLAPPFDTTSAVYC